MLRKTLFIFTIIFIGLVEFAAAQEKPLRCSKPTVYKRARIKPGSPEKTNYFAQFEEFCQRRTAKSGFIKHGPYRLWGPNSEVVIEGQFVNGKKSGKWMRWTPGETVVELWEDGKLVESNVSSEPRFVSIDYQACVPQAGTYYFSDGYSSTSFRVLGASGSYCIVRYTSDDAESIDPNRELNRIWTDCRIPRSKKKDPLTETESALYCKKSK